MERTALYKNHIFTAKLSASFFHLLPPSILLTAGLASMASAERCVVNSTLQLLLVVRRTVPSRTACMLQLSIG
jgi:hypothetical protein